jgi:hypothetical protein
LGGPVSDLFRTSGPLQGCKNLGTTASNKNSNDFSKSPKMGDDPISKAEELVKKVVS